MSNDKTLATVKHGGCVQLGGGPNIEARARELLATEYALSGSTKRADKIIAGFDCAPATEYAVRAIVAALAAHPPVRIYGCCSQPEGELHTAECPNMRHLAARQPVGEAYHVNAVESCGKILYVHPAGVKVGDTLYAARPAQVVDLERARNEGHDGAIRYVLGYLCGMGDWGSTQYVEILNGCGRESIIRSAIEDGELEFTGLGRWVAERGTDEERALIASQAVGNG